MKHLTGVNGQKLESDPRRQLESGESRGKYHVTTQEWRKHWNGSYWISSGSSGVYHPCSYGNAVKRGLDTFA